MIDHSAATSDAPAPDAMHAPAAVATGAAATSAPDQLPPGGFRAAVRRRATIAWRRPGVRHLVAALDRYNDRMGTQFAGSITYFSFLAMVPLLMVAFSVAGFVLASRPAVLTDLRNEIAAQLPDGLSDTVTGILDTAVEARLTVGIIGLCVALYSGVSWMGNVRGAIQAMWRPDFDTNQEIRAENLLVYYWKSLKYLAFFGLSILVSLGLTAAASWAQTWLLAFLGLGDSGWAAPVLRVVTFALAVAADVVTFGLLYRVLSPRHLKPTRRALIRGAALASVAFELLKVAFTVVLPLLLTSSTAKLFGPIIGLLLFFNFVATVVLFVAAWIATAPGEVSAGRPDPVPPAATILQDADARDVGPAVATEVRQMSPVALFERVFGAAPDGVWSAPGRVNLIGEHTDYNNGLVLPFAIGSRAELAARVTEDGVVHIVSAQQEQVVHSFPVADLQPGSPAATGWPAYLYGVLWVLRDAGHHISGLQLALDSDVPSGAGLSSSAAIECATALAAGDLFGLGLSTEQIARVSQAAENDFVGMPCGLMDQMASAACTSGHVLFFDIGHDTVEQVRFDPAAEGLAVLVIDTKVKHALTDGEYARRRASCEQAAAELGIESLRALSVDDLPSLAGRLSSDLLVRRVRHVVTENARVETTVDRLRHGRIREIGELMVASHHSLRDDYEVSDPALDLAVEVTMAHGAIGARMTGGGFGGSAIAVLPEPLVDPVSVAVLAAFAAENRTAPVIRTVEPGRGAARDG